MRETFYFYFFLLGYGGEDWWVIVAMRIRDRKRLWDLSKSNKGERERERVGGDRDGGFAFVSADDDDAKKNETGKH